jgi:hypothetical protein
MIDLTKDDFSSLSPVAAEVKAITGVKQLTPHEQVKFADGTVKEASVDGGYLVEFSDGMVKLLSNEAYERLIYG